MARRLADGDTRPVPNAHNRPLDDGAVSPDRTRIAFTHHASIELMSVADDEIIQLCARCAFDAPDLESRGLTFAGDDAIVYSAAGELRKISTAGGDWRVLVGPPAEVHAGGYTFPHALPGGEWLLATLLRGRSVDRAEIALVDTETGATRLLIEDGVNARYVASGHVVFVRHGDLWAVPFDLEQRAPVGEPTLVREGIMMSAADGLSRYAVSENGDLAYIAGDTYIPSRRIVSVARNGQPEPLLDARGRFEGVQLSPDFTKAAVEAIDGGDYDIRIYDLDDVDGGEPITLGSEFIDERHPVWSPDGTRLAFAAEFGDVTTLYWKRADGDRQYVDGELDARRGASLIPQSWSRDGVLAYVVVEGDSWDIWTVDVNGGQPREFLTADREIAAAFSPDGLWLAYSVIALSDDGPTGIRVVSFPEPRTVVDLGSWGTNLQWSPDGRELCFAGSGLRCAALLTAPGSEPAIRFGDPQRTGGRFYYHRHRFSIGPDGRSFAVVDEASFRTPLANQIVLVTDWFDDLRRLAPIDH